MTDFKKLIALLQQTIDDFDKTIPGIQKRMLDALRTEIQGFDVVRGGIKVSAANIKKIAQIKAKLEGIILSPEYVRAVKEYTEQFDQVTKLQNSYFNQIDKKFTPPKLFKQLRKQAITGVVDQLTERGLAGNVINGVEEILRKNITTGGSYADLQTALENNLTTNDTGAGSLQRYTKQITTDALNQYSAQYTQLVTSDLGFEWFVYAGSNLETTRPFCLACVKKRYIHISEFPALLQGDFEEFREFDGKLYKGLPAGMIADTTVSNFQINRGGHNCGHQLRPVDASQVPADVKNAVYANAAYKAWASATGATVQSVEKPSALTKEEVSLLKNDPTFRTNLREVKNKSAHAELNDVEKAVVYGYSDVDYGKINRYLRSKNTEVDPFKDAYVKALNQALDKMDSAYDGYTFRGTNLSDSAIKAYRDALQSGDPIVHEYFTSSSKNPHMAFDGNVNYAIKSKTGKSIEKIAALPEEAEVLFKAGTPFKVTKIYDRDDKTYIELEEL